MSNLDEIPRGQLSTIILTCLSQQDKYGYEIIDEVLKKTNGRMSIKQPSLYSSLKRMEEQSLISSYWRESEIGGRRHYYHLTDLGKKHLEKWQDSLPDNFLNNDTNTEIKNNETKVLQQESLFNLTTPVSEKVKQEVKVEEKAFDNSYVQYDLFSNSVIITPPAQSETDKDTTEIHIEKPSSDIVPAVENKVENQIIFKDFDFVKKSNKSFADKVKTINSIDEKKFIEENQIISNSYNIKAETYKNDNLQPLLSNVNDITNITSTEVYLQENIIDKEISSNINVEEISNEEINVSEEQTYEEIENHKPVFTEKTFNETNNMAESYENIINKEINLYEYSVNKEENIQKTHIDELSNNVNFEKIEGYIPRPKPTQESVIKQEENKQEEVKDDGIFITDRLNPEDMPKPYKWDSRRFEVYLSDNSITPYLDKENSNYEDRVKELYEKSKNSSDNQKINIVDNVIKFSTYQELQEFYANQNIKFKPYQKRLKKTERDYDMIKINKFNMITALSLFLIISVISAVTGVIFSVAESAYFNSPITFIIYPAILLIFFIVRYLTYLKSPQKRIAHDINRYKLSFGISTISILFIPMIFAVNLMTGFTFNLTDMIKHSITIVIPCLIALTYFIYYFIQKITLKFKSMY